MDQSGAPTSQPVNQPVATGLPNNLIRVDQIQKLPHLDQKQKIDHMNVVRNFQEILSSREPQSPEYQNAFIRLTHISQNLLKGMRAFQQSRQQQAQAVANQNQQGQPAQRAQAANPQNFTQLLPQVQQKINSIQLFPPSNFSPDQVQQWLAEARLRYGIALQKHEVGRARLAELRQIINQRQGAGNLSREETHEFKNRQLAAERIIREGNEFVSKFREQQEAIKTQRGLQVNQAQASMQNVAGQAQAPQAASTDQTQSAAVAMTPGREGYHQAQPGQAPTPAPHTVNSAMNAARSQTGQQMATASPVTSQPGQQPPTAQGAAVQQQLQQTPLSQAHVQQPHETAQGSSQITFSQSSTPGLSASTPTTATPGGAPQQQPQQSATQQGPPRPLSHQAAMQQAAQNYSSTLGQQQTMQQAASVNPHAHPQGYIQNNRPPAPNSTATTTTASTNNDNSIRGTHMPIPKSLEMQKTPEPVPMPAARPTLSGGPSNGAVGVMGQPAIQKHPGYVLEGEGQRILSKKMLDILVRQVTGGGEGEGFTPDAEEFILQMADDFVDDVIVAACRLAKLRPSSTLEVRDIQLVLERNYNMRISGFATDDLRTVKKPQPTQGWTQKMSAIQAAKVTQGRAE